MTTPRPFPIKPNFRQTFEVTYSFLTEVVLSEAGTEQRRAWRDTPRKAIQFLVSGLTPDRFTGLKAFLAATQGQAILVPEMPRSVHSVGAASGYTLEVDSVPSWIKADATVILIAGERVEGRTISSVAGSAITFEESSATPWPDDTIVAPGVISRAAAEQQTSHIVRGKNEGSFTFQVEPCVEFEDFDDDPEATWNGREVFIRSCNWAEAQDLTFLHDTQVVDYGYGKTATFQPVAYGTEKRTADILATTYEEAESVVAFYRRMRGMLGEFYAPTDEADILITGLVNIGATTITVPGTTLADNYGMSTVFKAISVKMNDGRRFYRGVEKVEVVSGNSRITLTAAVPYSLTPSTVEVISWLPVMRLASDELTVVWTTHSVATIRLNFMTLEAEDPE